MGLDCNHDNVHMEAVETDIVAGDLVSALDHGPNRD